MIYALRPAEREHLRDRSVVEEVGVLAQDSEAVVAALRGVDLCREGLRVPRLSEACQGL